MESGRTIEADKSPGSSGIAAGGMRLRPSPVDPVCYVSGMSELWRWVSFGGSKIVGYSSTKINSILAVSQALVGLSVFVSGGIVRF